MEPEVNSGAPEQSAGLVQARQTENVDEFVVLVQRPLTSETSLVQRKQRYEDVELIDFDKLNLPVADTPKGGYHYASDLAFPGNVIAHVVLG